MTKWIFTAALAAGLSFLPIQQAETVSTTQYFIKAKATDKFTRSLIADTGVAIENVSDDFVIAYGSKAELAKLEKMGLVDVSFPMTQTMMDFPSEDAVYHNYTEVRQALEAMHAEFPDITELKNIGKTVQGRDIISIRISDGLGDASQKAGILFVGGHHAREHLSVDLPIRLLQQLLQKYKQGDAKIVGLLRSRDIHVIPAVNPDGLEYDIASGRYQMWRKNRRMNANGTYGVDLNRNYSFGWGGGGASTTPSSETFRGPSAFSEPETQAIRDYVAQNTNLSILLSFHTFSKLILYPWGHKYDKIGEERDRRTHEVMAQTMAQWNGYTPQQSSELYIASGDTSDWAYGEHKMITFTFELDPANTGWGGAGFYPGAEIIPEVVNKNWNPFLYLIEYADNPYRVLQN